MKATIVYSEPEQIENIDFPSDLDLLYLDENSLKTRRKARGLKGSYAAKETPCVFVYNDKNEIDKIFYAEVSKNPIKDFIDWYVEKINNVK